MNNVRKGRTNTPNLVTNVAPTSTQKARGKARRLARIDGMTTAGKQKARARDRGRAQAKREKERERKINQLETPTKYAERHLS
jgi:hypothetical protein